MGRRTVANRKIKVTTAERAERRHERDIQQAAARAGLPDAQRDHALALCEAPQIGSAPSPIRETVRKLTRVETLERSGVLERHEAAACEWYADRYTLGFEAGSGCTANYEGASGGGFGVHDLLARHKAQADAREDYAWARTFLPPPYVALFEAIVCRSETIAGIAAERFAALKRSQAENRTRIALKLCANLLHGGIASLLPIDVGAAPALKPANDRTMPAPAPPGPAPRPISAAIDEELDRAGANDMALAGIHIAPLTLQALAREVGLALDPDSGEPLDPYRDLPLFVQPGWSWGHMLAPAS